MNLTRSAKFFSSYSLKISPIIFEVKATIKEKKKEMIHFNLELIGSRVKELL